MSDGEGVAGSDIDALSARLRAIRETLGKTQAEFAAATGVSRSFLSEMESGRSKPSTQLVLGVAQAFPEIDRDWLLSGKGKMAKWANDGLLPTNWAGAMRFGSDTKLSAADPDALRCAVGLLEEVIAQDAQMVRPGRQIEFISIIYNFYLGAYQDAFRKPDAPDPTGYARKVCAEWAQRLAGIPSNALPSESNLASP